MSFGFANLAMLAGLFGVGLPVLAHLLSKKRYDVVEWGAMQFLELGKNTRRRIRLEEILLMLLRMGLIALIALALARPWAEGGVLAKYVSTQSRDVVFVVDGSYSMGWEGGAVTPHAAAVEWAHGFLEELNPGDAVAVLDARDQVRPVIDAPARDFGFVRETLNGLPPPSGSADLAEATAEGVRIASRSSNVARDVIVLTDGQAHDWKADDQLLWTRFDDLVEQSSVRPRVWIVDVTKGDAGARVNFSLGRVELSRELTVPDFPVRIRTKVSYSGGDEPATKRVFLEVDGQRLADKTVSVRLEPDGEASVEFEYRFPSAGSHLVSVVLDGDNLPGDDRADAAVTVTEALPVLLIDGDPKGEPILSDTFFARAALSSNENDTPWVRATVVSIDRLDPRSLVDYEVVVLANVPSPTAELADALRSYVASGGGVFFALGDRVDARTWNERLFGDGDDLLPAQLVNTERANDPDKGVQARESSLESPWLKRFRSEGGGGFTRARFDQWWRVRLPQLVPKKDEIEFDEDRDDREGEVAEEAPEATPSRILASLSIGSPLIVGRRYGLGRSFVMTTPIDADWSTLPAKEDFVPFLHETIFQLAGGRTLRNVQPGIPLVLPVADEANLEEYAFFGPGETEFAAETEGTAERRLAKLSDTRLPGVYAFRRRDDERNPEYFVVAFDREESDLTPLTDAQREMLSNGDRVGFVEDAEQLREAMFTDVGRAEFWEFLLLAFVGLLIGEVVMTRNLVKGGHAVAGDESVHELDTDGHGSTRMLE